MENKIKVSCVSYLNSKPFIYGFDNFPELKNYMQLDLDIPSVCAKKLVEKKVDIGLVPVAIINKLDEYEIISDYCIGTNGNVKSVNLYSDVTIENIEEIILDFHSQSSITLVKVLSKFYWKKNIKFIDADTNFIKNIKGNTAGVIIGDRTFGLKNQYKYIYDLSSEWKIFTGLPFVFACWIVNRKIDSPEFLKLFTQAIKFGIENKKNVIEQLSHKSEYQEIDLNDYLNNCIDYELNDDKIKAMKLFLEYSKGI
jgi:chorismate dehydratase